MAKNGYTTLNLPTSLVEVLKVWRMAFGNAYGRQVTYAEIIRVMLGSLESCEPSVVSELKRLVKVHPELMAVFGEDRSK